MVGLGCADNNMAWVGAERHPGDNNRILQPVHAATGPEIARSFSNTYEWDMTIKLDNCHGTAADPFIIVP
jgi:hypothetical protein